MASIEFVGQLERDQRSVQSASPLPLALISLLITWPCRARSVFTSRQDLASTVAFPAPTSRGTHDLRRLRTFEPASSTTSACGHNALELSCKRREEPERRAAQERHHTSGPTAAANTGADCLLQRTVMTCTVERRTQSPPRARRFAACPRIMRHQPGADYRVGVASLVAPRPTGHRDFAPLRFAPQIHPPHRHRERGPTPLRCHEGEGSTRAADRNRPTSSHLHRRGDRSVRRRHRAENRPVLLWTRARPPAHCGE
jgi:hypothetical protein